MESIPELAECGVDLVVTGFPGTSPTNGGLGWSSIVLLRLGQRNILIDTGAMSVRGFLIKALAKRGLNTSDITDLILTHAHHDHMVNWPMFDAATVYISRNELDWAVTMPPGRTEVPVYHALELQKYKRLVYLEEGPTPIPGLTAFYAPGHSPWHQVLLLKSDTRNVLFAADAAKNRVEMLTRQADMTRDEQASKKSFDLLWSLWSERPGTVLIPGHDRPMIIEDGKPKYISEHESQIKAWLGDSFQEPTNIRLSGE